MRLNRLDLVRYGRFNEAGITFPRPEDGSADVTVVFGPNEAGKSTAFSGFLDLLFGFRPGTHPAAFRFDRSDLLVGAELDLPGRSAMVFHRNGKRDRSLMDAQGRPVDEAILVSALHGLDRDGYLERFSLNNDSLRRGGERIAGAQGDLGQLLHAGVSGLTGIASVLDDLAARADRFHKKHGRATTLKAGKDRLTDIGRELRADRLTAERDRTLRRDCDKARAGFKAAEAALRQAHRRTAAAEAAQVWHDLTRKIEGTTEALADGPGGPLLPPDAAERVAGLVEKCAGLERRIVEADEDVAALDAEIAASPADPDAASLTAELARLDTHTLDGAPLMGRATTARADLARRHGEREELDRQILALLAQLGVPEGSAPGLVLTEAALEELGQAAQDCFMADLRLTPSDKAAEAARRQLGEAPARPRDLSALRAASEAWMAVADLGAQEAECEHAAARLTRAAAQLPVAWRELVDRGLPAPETLDALEREWSVVSADLATAAQERATRAGELAQASADREAQAAAPGAVDVATTEDTRRRRDMAWQRHRDGLSAASADHFETAMAADDAARAHYLHGTEARQRLHSAVVQERAAQARFDGAESREAGLTTRRDQLAGQVARAARALGLPEDAMPAAFAGRHRALAAAADAAADMATAQDALAARVARRQAAEEALAAAAGAVGLEPEAGDLPGRAQRALLLEDSDRKAWAKWQEAAEALTRLEAEAQAAHAARDEAGHLLEALSAPLPLPDRAPDAVRAAVPLLRRLHQLDAERNKLGERIEALESASAALTEGALRLAEILGVTEDAARADPVRCIDTARARADAAARAEEKRAGATTRRDDRTRAKARAQAELEAARQELDSCFDGQGGADMPTHDRIARLVARDRLRTEVAAWERDRVNARAEVDAELFAEELDLLPDASRASEVQQALADAQLARDAARDVQREADRLHDAAYAAADRGDLATEQATLLEVLRGGARDAAVARLGVLAARGALRRLAAERRSEMLRDVEAAFVTMTAPAWIGVDVWSQSEGEKLVGVQPGGGTVPVEQMSTGTMGQLYFALRLAGYRSFARSPGPLPMILDDIMETFDDDRARAALRLCAEIGANGQAVLFTHHAHLVTLARDSIPGVAIVEMPE